MRWILLLLVCLAGVGFYRGWFNFSNPARDAATSKLNINVSVDTAKVESDILAAKQRVDAAIVGQGQTPSETASAVPAWQK